MYDSYGRVRSIYDAYALSSIPLPKHTGDYTCAVYDSESLPSDVKPGDKVDLVFGDPRLLKSSTLVEKGASKMPKEHRSHILLIERWWTWRWRGRLLFMEWRQTALAEKAKIKKD